MTNYSKHDISDVQEDWINMNMIMREIEEIIIQRKHGAIKTTLSQMEMSLDVSHRD